MLVDILPCCRPHACSTSRAGPTCSLTRSPCKPVLRSYGWQGGSPGWPGSRAHQLRKSRIPSADRVFVATTAAVPLLSFRLAHRLGGAQRAKPAPDRRALHVLGPASQRCNVVVMQTPATAAAWEEGFDGTRQRAVRVVQLHSLPFTQLDTTAASGARHQRTQSTGLLAPLLAAHSYVLLCAAALLLPLLAAWTSYRH
jgi:hypothetical protein